MSLRASSTDRPVKRAAEIQGRKIHHDAQYARPLVEFDFTEHRAIVDGVRVYSIPSRSKRSSSRRQWRRTRTLQVEVNLGAQLRAPASAAALPISPILARSCRSGSPSGTRSRPRSRPSTVTSAVLPRARPRLTLTSTEWGSPARVRFRTCSRISSASSSSLGLVAGSSRRVHVGPLGDQLAEPARAAAPAPCRSGR